jgi:hypothetical protein
MAGRITAQQKRQAGPGEGEATAERLVNAGKKTT